MDTIKNKIKNSLSYYFDLLSEIESKFKVKAYIVGGAVRDAGIDEKVKDIDIVIIPYRYNVSINLLELQTKKYRLHRHFLFISTHQTIPNIQTGSMNWQ